MENLKYFNMLSHKETGGETSDTKTKAASELETKDENKRAKKEKLQWVLNNPSEALEKNEKLRNAVVKKQKELGLNILDDALSTDMRKIQLNSKIHIALNNNNGRVNLMLIGKSGSGQTSLISYLTTNHELKGADTMFAQSFQGVTFDILINGGNATVRVHESPGMCSGFEVPQLEEHWNRLIESVNQQGGVSIFLLLIKSNERVTAQFIDELEEFSELYFEDKKMFWERTIVMFTAIDELTDCNTLKERVKKIQMQINMRGLEKLKRVVERTGKECLYVNCFDEQDKQRITNDLTSLIVSMLPDYFVHTREIDNLEPVYKTNENNFESIPILAVKPHHLNQKSSLPLLDLKSSLTEPYPHSLNQFYSEDIITITKNERSNIDEPNSVYQTPHASNTPDMDFLQTLNRDQLIWLLKVLCKKKKLRKKCKICCSQLFPETKTIDDPKAKQSKFKWLKWK